jgi:predicted DNA-binding transcriptional regulator AlpA
MTTPLVVDARAAAELLGVSVRLFHSLRKQSEFPAPRSLVGGGRLLRWSTRELLAWLESRPHADRQAEPAQLAARRNKGAAVGARA